MATTGMPIWYELMTSDTAGAERFYRDVVGWTAAPFDSDTEQGVYRLWNADDGKAVGGLMALPQGAPMMPGWFVYLQVDDVDAAVATIERTGGKIHMAARATPGVGRMALAADPQGALVYVMTPDPAMDGGESTSFSATLPQRCWWNELVTTDQDAALAFYAALAGWTSTEAMPMGAMGDYRFVDCGDTRVGAMMTRAAPEQPIKWTFYFAVADVDVAIGKVTAGGGTIIMGPVDVPGGQRIILCLDPQGAAVGFVSGARR